MADQVLAARDAFAGAAFPQAWAGVGTPGLTVERLPDATMVRMAARRGQRRRLGERLQAGYGLALPDGPGVAAANGVCLVGIGPQTWLVLGLEQDALQAVAGEDASLFDWSDSRALLRIGGAMRREALAKGVPVDLHARAFGAGSAAVTRAGHLGIILWQQDASPFLTLAVPRSHASDLLRFLIQSGAEYGVGPG